MARRARSRCKHATQWPREGRLSATLVAAACMLLCLLWPLVARSTPTAGPSACMRASRWLALPRGCKTSGAPRQRSKPSSVARETTTGGDSPMIPGSRTPLSDTVRPCSRRTSICSRSGPWIPAVSRSPWTQSRAGRSTAEYPSGRSGRSTAGCRRSSCDREETHSTRVVESSFRPTSSLPPPPPLPSKEYVPLRDRVEYYRSPHSLSRHGDHARRPIEGGVRLRDFDETRVDAEYQAIVEVLGEAAADRAIASQAMPGVPSKPSDVFLRPLRDLMQSTSDPSVYARAGIALDGLRSKRMSAAEMRAAFAQWPSGALTGVSEGLMERERQGDVQCGVERSCFEEMARGLTGAMPLGGYRRPRRLRDDRGQPNMVESAGPRRSRVGGPGAPTDHPGLGSRALYGWRSEGRGRPSARDVGFRHRPSAGRGYRAEPHTGHRNGPGA